MKNSKVCEILGIQYPVICASMTWITSAELAAAISNAGGLGMLGPNAGQTTLTNNPIETAERMRREIHKTRSLTSKPFAVNYLLPDPSIDFTVLYAGPMFDMLCEEREQKIVLASGNLNADEIKKLKAAGKTVIYRDAAPTIHSFKAAEAAGADIIIATGVEAGGHVSNYRIGTLNVIPLAKKAVSIPVIAAGGIVDTQSVKAVCALGAEGIYAGTRFIASTECPCAQSTKDAIVASTTDDLVEFPGMVGFMRCIKNPVTLKCAEMAKQCADIMEITKMYSGGFMTGMLLGDQEKGINSVNAAIGQINEIKSCHEIMNDFVAGME